jgi:hypothetical protein
MFKSSSRHRVQKDEFHRKVSDMISSYKKNRLVCSYLLSAWV